VDFARDRDWDRFHEDIAADPVCKPVREVLHALSLVHHIAILTGRPDRYRTETLSWLNKSGVEWSRLLMREDGDRRPDYEVKLSTAHENGLTPENVLLVLEDRDRMTQKWREFGYTCFQVAKGLY